MRRVKDLIVFLRTQSKREFVAENGIQLKLSDAGSTLWCGSMSGDPVTGDDIEAAIEEALR